MRMTKKQKRAEQLIADLIFRVSPRIDARAVAKGMIQRHISLAPALERHPVDLMGRDGLNKTTAQLISALPQLARYVRTEQASGPDAKLNALSGCGRYFAARCVGLHHERMFLMCLGEDGRRLDSGAIADGTLDETPFYLRMVIERAMRCGARYLVLCHNHPSGAAYASISDVNATRTLLAACKALGLVLLDHLIIADNVVVSMREDNFSESDFLDQSRQDPLLIRWLRD